MAVAIQSAQISLETMSDNIDSVNVHKTDLQKDRGLYDGSKFDKSKDKAGFRQFEDACDQVKTFYAQQHTLQTVAYNLKARNDFTNKTRANMTVWEAMEKLNTFIDECDPDTSETQMTHLLQSAEAIRKSNPQRRKASLDAVGRTYSRPWQTPLLLLRC
jgi:inositol oxygenase